MRDLLHEGNAWLEKMRTRFAARRFTYSRGASNSAVPGTMGRVDFEVEDSQGLLTRLEAWDFLVRARDLVLDDIAVEPQTGDRIIEGEIGSGQVYEVMDVAGQHCWRWSDPNRTTYRIHTKWVGTQPLS